MSVPKVNKLGTIIPNTNIAVDYWYINRNPHSNDLIRFMTTMKTQCEESLSLIRKAKYTIHTSLFNKWYLYQFYEIPEERIAVINFNDSVEMYDFLKNEKFNVTAIESNYCLGSTMFLFEGPFGNVLYTGYFRTSVTAPIYDCPALQCLIKKKNLHLMFVDNSYAAEHCNFPGRHEAIQEIIQFIRDCKTSEIIISGNQLGKEEVLLAIASELDEKIHVSEIRFQVFQKIQVSDFFTVSENDSRIRVIDHLLSSFECRQIFNENKTCVIILLTALYTYGPMKFPSRIKFPRLHIVAYSGHCNHTELKQFISILQPRTIVPIINACERRPCTVIPSSIFELCSSNEETREFDFDFDKHVPEKYLPIVLVPRIASPKSYSKHPESKYPFSALNLFDTKKTNNLVFPYDTTNEKNFSSAKKSYLSEKMSHSGKNITRNVEADASGCVPHVLSHEEELVVSEMDENGKKFVADYGQPSRGINNENHFPKITSKCSEFSGLKLHDADGCNVLKEHDLNSDINHYENEDGSSHEILPTRSMSDERYISEESEEIIESPSGTFIVENYSVGEKQSVSPFKRNAKRFSNSEFLSKNISVQYRYSPKVTDENLIPSINSSLGENCRVQADQSEEYNYNQNELQDINGEVSLAEDVRSLTLFSSDASFFDKSVESEKNQIDCNINTSDLIVDLPFDSDFPHKVCFESTIVEKVTKIDQNASKNISELENDDLSSISSTSLNSSINQVESTDWNGLISVSSLKNPNYRSLAKKSTSSISRNNKEFLSENDSISQISDDLISESDENSSNKILCDIESDSRDSAHNESNSCEIIETNEAVNLVSPSSNVCLTDYHQNYDSKRDHSESDSDDCLIVGEYIADDVTSIRSDNSCPVGSYHPPSKKSKLTSSSSSVQKVPRLEMNDPSTYSILYHYSKLYNFKNCGIPPNQWDYLTGCNIFSHDAYKQL